MLQEHIHGFAGEALGTFILVFFGISAVAVSVLFSAHTGLFQVAIVWGIGVFLAIYCTRHLSCAHLNPAVSLAMVLAKRMELRRLPVYWLAQVIGAFLAGAILYFLDFRHGSEAGYPLVPNRSWRVSGPGLTGEAFTAMVKLTIPGFTGLPGSARFGGKLTHYSGEI